MLYLSSVLLIPALYSPLASWQGSSASHSPCPFLLQAGAGFSQTIWIYFSPHSPLCLVITCLSNDQLGAIPGNSLPGTAERYRGCGREGLPTGGMQTYPKDNITSQDPLSWNSSAIPAWPQRCCSPHSVPKLLGTMLCPQLSDPQLGAIFPWWQHGITVAFSCDFIMSGFFQNFPQLLESQE